MGIKRESADSRVNEWYGDKGDKVQVRVRVVDSRVIESYLGYGAKVTHLYTIEGDAGTEAGRTFKWFASRRQDALHDAKQAGDPVTLVGTVKAHEEWEGRRSTLLTRCKVE